MTTDREDYLKTHIVAIAEEAFPDNLGLEWIVRGFVHRGDFTVVEVEPQPDEVGYTRFKLVQSFANPQKPKHNIACYCFEDGKWQLLFGDSAFAPRTSPDSFPPRDTRKPSKVLSVLFVLLGGAFLLVAWHFWNIGEIASEGFNNRGAMTVTREGDPLSFWLYIGVMSFIGGSFFIGGLRSLFK